MVVQESNFYWLLSRLKFSCNTACWRWWWWWWWWWWLWWWWWWWWWWSVCAGGWMCLWPPVATESPGIWIKVCRILRLSHSPPPPAHALSRHHTAHTTSYYHTQPPHTTLPTPHLITRHHTQPSTTATSCHSCFTQSLPFPLWYHLVEDQNYTKLWLGHFLPPRHFPSVNTFSAWSPCKEGQERGGGGGLGPMREIAGVSLSVKCSPGVPAPWVEPASL